MEFYLNIPKNYRQKLIEEKPDRFQDFYEKGLPAINTKVTFDTQSEFVEVAYALINMGVHSVFDQCGDIVNH